MLCVPRRTTQHLASQSSLLPMIKNASDPSGIVILKDYWPTTDRSTIEGEAYKNLHNALELLIYERYTEPTTGRGSLRRHRFIFRTMMMIHVRNGGTEYSCPMQSNQNLVFVCWSLCALAGNLCWTAILRKDLR